MTQERLHRLLVDNPSLVLDQILVDEAHNLLAADQRAVELSVVLLIARHRNERLAITYYTPFISNPDSLRHVLGVDQRMRSLSINEHVKAEQLVIASPGAAQQLYDQFLNRLVDLNDVTPADEVEAVIQLGQQRTLVYVNRPKEAQELAKRIADRQGSVLLSPEAQKAITAIADIIDPAYSLIDVVRGGVLFHHGQVPDVLRQYIERLFREDESQDSRILVTTSTLLEGVNTPADCMVVMSPSKGRRYLSRSEFRNLIGRVARFK
jgi:replicative superfamily II helicase